MPDFDAKVPANSLAGASAGGGVEPIDREGALALATSPIERVSAPSAPTRASVGGPARAPTDRRPALVVYLDLVALAIATPVALVLGAPVLGYCVGAGAWLLQRGVGIVARGLVRRAAEPGNRLGLSFVEAFARIWLLAGAIIAAGVIGRRADGLAAAVVIFSAYSIAFMVRLASGRPPEGPAQ
jgi:hypothetical protein